MINFLWIPGSKFPANFKVETGMNIYDCYDFATYLIKSSDGLRELQDYTSDCHIIRQW